MPNNIMDHNIVALNNPDDAGISNNKNRELIY